MEAAIRWSPGASSESPRFLIADVANNKLRHCEVTSGSAKTITFNTLWQREKLPIFNAFDWNRHDEKLVAIGTEAGEVKILSTNSTTDFNQNFALRLQRKCNSIAWSSRTRLAAALDKARNDPSSLRVYDLQPAGTSQQAETGRRIPVSDSVTNVKFFLDQPDVLLCGVARKCLSLYDLRDPSTLTAASFVSRNVHSLSIDPLDENYFASIGPPGHNIINVWDRRFVSQGSVSISGTTQTTPVLEITPAVGGSTPANIWSMRYSGYRRGCFAVLSSVGQLRLYETSNYSAYSTESGHEDYKDLSERLHMLTHFTKTTQDLVVAAQPGSEASKDQSKLIAFDHVRPGVLSDRESVLCMRQSRSLETIDIPNAHAHANAPRMTELSSSPEATREHGDFVPSMTISKPTGLADIETGPVPNVTTNLRSQAYGDMAAMSSRDRHARLIEDMQVDEAQKGFPRVNIQEARCRAGYLFDASANRRIVAEDPWLVELWEIVKRLDDMAANNGMVHDALDLSYLGVHDIWFENIGNNQSRVLGSSNKTLPDFAIAVRSILARQRYGDFQGAKTQFPARRQLCLALCGWKFDQRRLREKCTDIISRHEYYKAIVVAVCHGHRDIANDLLRSLVRTKAIDNSGLAAVIACDKVTQEQRELCQWMADEAEDPYLKALLQYFVTGDWYSVVTMTELPLTYRVAVALKYLDDERLSNFLKSSTQDTIQYGDTEGIILTGLTESSMGLFQNYISRFNDLQTAVLAMGFVVPRYVQDPRWPMWKEAYLGDLQSWRAYIERTRFTALHNRRASSRKGMQSPLRPALGQISLRCMHCQKSIARRDPAQEQPDIMSSTSSIVSRIKRSGTPASVACPQCMRRLSRCCICMESLGSPDPGFPAVAEAAGVVDLLAWSINHCIVCNHGSHPHHARDWFRANKECPVPDCQCECNVV